MSKTYTDSLPSWCTGKVDQILPNDIAINIDRGVASVIVRRLTANEYLVVPKYISAKQGAWRTPLLGPLERVLNLYSPRSVKKVARYVNNIWSPNYGVYVPIEHINDSTSKVYVCSGYKVILTKNFAELDKYSNYKWSLIYNRFIDLAGLSISSLSQCLWPTGSILMGSFRPFSDIDLVLSIDAPACYKKVIDFIEALNNTIEIKTAATSELILKEARGRNIDASILKNAIRKWQRLYIDNVEVSISLANINYRLRPETRIFKTTNKLITKTVYIEPYQVSVGDYPAIAQSNEEYIVSYDGIFTPLLFEGNKVFIRGVKGTINYGDEHIEAIIIGVSEQVTYAYPITD